jgi:hypothetical protein
VGNRAANTGGGIYGTLTSNNTIVAGNTAQTSADIAGTLAGAYNLIGDGTGQTALVNGIDGNIVGTTTNPIDPLFVKIPVTISESNTGENYNPAVWDLCLAAGSPAIDKGNNALAVYAYGNFGTVCYAPRRAGFVRLHGSDVSGLFQFFPLFQPRTPYLVECLRLHSLEVSELLYQSSDDVELVRLYEIGVSELL